MAGMFAGIEEVELKKKARYVEPGNYECTIQAVKTGRTAQEEKPYFVVEMKVVKSDNDTFREGDSQTWITMLHKFKHYWLEEIKDFVASAMESLPDEVTEEVVDYVSGEEQPLNGINLSVRAWTEVNKKTGKGFTRAEFKRLH